jgi:ribonuclease D
LSHEPTFFERKKLAIQKWGKVQIRPQKLDPAFLTYRQHTNNFNYGSILVHPHQQAIIDWKPTEYMLKRIPPSDNTEFKWITTEQELELLALDLDLEKVIAVDFENNHDNSYLCFNCLIQISTNEQNYLIDTLRLYSCINKFLGPIFSNPCILKLVLGSTDLSDLQRDFHIFCQAVIDLQEVYHYINPDTFSIGFKNLVASYLGKSVDKLPQVADWRVRPLCPDLEQYAVNDAKLLLHCWFLLLDDSDLTQCSFSRSKQNMLKLYKCPKLLSAVSSWSQSIQALPCNLRGIFNIKEQELLYTKLFNWRILKAKYLDVLPTYFITNDKLALLSRAKPTTSSNVYSLIPKSRNWPVDFIPELLELISDSSNVVTCDDSSRQQNISEPMDIECPLAGESPDFSRDISPEDIVIEIENDIFTGSPNHIETPKLGQNLSDRFARTRRNHSKRAQLWYNRRSKNSVRIQKNLPRIRYYRNKGLKHKARQVSFRALH